MGNNMFQNIKVDIIYYKTATDFEMEFNLCGCCRMRLLTDKAPDRKSMVHGISIARARSDINTNEPFSTHTKNRFFPA